MRFYFGTIHNRFAVTEKGSLRIEDTFVGGWLSSWRLYLKFLKHTLTPKTNLILRKITIWLAFNSTIYTLLTNLNYCDTMIIKYFRKDNCIYEKIRKIPKCRRRPLRMNPSINLNFCAKQVSYSLLIQNGAKS